MIWLKKIIYKLSHCDLKHTYMQSLFEERSIYLSFGGAMLILDRYNLE